MASTSFYVFLTVLFFVLALPLCYIVLLFFTRSSRKTTPLACTVCQFLALYTCVIAFPLLVVDINAGFHADTEQTWMRPVWLTIFILSYFSAWISLPVAQMYTEVGEFEWKRALWHSIKMNVKLYAVVITLIFLILAYLVISKGAYTSISSVGKVIISLANSWGLLMLILFMPAGLVGVPRKLWRNADPTRELCRLFFDAVDLQEELDLATLDLAKMKGELISIDPLVAETHRVHLASMLEQIAEAEKTVPMYRTAVQRLKGIQPRTRPPLGGAEGAENEDVSLTHLEALNAKLKSQLKVTTRVNFRWNAAIRRCERLDRIARGRVNDTDPWWRRALEKHRRGVYMSGCVGCGLLTVIVLWGEVTLPFRLLTTFPLGLVEVLMHVAFLQFITSVVFLFYMAYCSFWAAFQFKVFNVYVIYPGIADNASLCFNEVFLVRLLMPLCFNFLLLSGLATSEEDVQYGHVYRRNMDISLLFGTVINQFLPLVIPVVAAIVFFKLTGKVLKLVGVEVYNPDEVLKPSVQERLAHGKRLIEEDLGHALGEVRGVGSMASEVVIVGGEGASASSSAAALGSRVEADGRYTSEGMGGGDEEAGGGEFGGGGRGSHAVDRGARYKEYLRKKQQRDG